MVPASLSSCALAPQVSQATDRPKLKLTPNERRLVALSMTGTVRPGCDQVALIARELHLGSAEAALLVQTLADRLEVLGSDKLTGIACQAIVKGLAEA